MNTKLLLWVSSILLGLVGIVLTFLPEELLNYLGLEINRTVLLFVQILGAFYFAFGMLNWMVKSSLVGGIYNRPIVVANFSHFFIAGMALLKELFSTQSLSLVLSVIAIVYIIFAVSFGLILYQHPQTNR